MTTKGVPKNQWTEQELAIVRAHYGPMGPAATKKMLPKRTYSAVREMGLRLGLQIPGRRANLLAWTPEQDALLIEHYPTKGGDFVAALVGGKTRNGVAKRAKALGIKRLPVDAQPPKEYEESDVDESPMRHIVIPAGLWRASNIPTVRSVFDLADAA